MKGGITYASCKEIGGETSSQKSGACKESDSKEGSGEEGGEKGCFSGEKDRCQEIGRLVFATVVRTNRRRLISPPIFLGIKIQFAQRIGSGTRRLRRKIPLLFGKESLKIVCFDSFILKQALKQTRSVCLRAS